MKKRSITLKYNELIFRGLNNSYKMLSDIDFLSKVDVPQSLERHWDDRITRIERLISICMDDEKGLNYIIVDFEVPKTGESWNNIIGKVTYTSSEIKELREGEFYGTHSGILPETDLF